MTGRGFKEVRVMQYTETVYFNAAGEEIGREHGNDDTWYDGGDREPMTDDEMEDWL